MYEVFSCVYGQIPTAFRIKKDLNDISRYVNSLCFVCDPTSQYFKSIEKNIHNPVSSYEFIVNDTRSWRHSCIPFLLFKLFYLLGSSLLFFVVLPVVHFLLHVCWNLFSAFFSFTPSPTFRSVRLVFFCVGFYMKTCLFLCPFLYKNMFIFVSVFI